MKSFIVALSFSIVLLDRPVEVEGYPDKTKCQPVNVDVSGFGAHGKVKNLLIPAMLAPLRSLEPTI